MDRTELLVPRSCTVWKRFPHNRWNTSKNTEHRNNEVHIHLCNFTESCFYSMPVWHYSEQTVFSIFRLNTTTGWYFVFWWSQIPILAHRNAEYFQFSSFLLCKYCDSRVLQIWLSGGKMVPGISKGKLATTTYQTMHHIQEDCSLRYSPSWDVPNFNMTFLTYVQICNPGSGKQPCLIQFNIWTQCMGFSRQCCWRSKSLGKWHHVIWPVVPNILKNLGVSTFGVKYSSWHTWSKRWWHCNPSKYYKLHALWQTVTFQKTWIK